MVVFQQMVSIYDILSINVHDILYMRQYTQICCKWCIIHSIYVYCIVVMFFTSMHNIIHKCWACDGFIIIPCKRHTSIHEHALLMASWHWITFQNKFPSKTLEPIYSSALSVFQKFKPMVCHQSPQRKRLWSISMHPKMRRGSMRKMWTFTGILKVCPEIPGVARLMIFDEFFSHASDERSYWREDPRPWVLKGSAVRQAAVDVIQVDEKSSDST